MKIDREKVLQEIIDLRIRSGYSTSSIVKYLEENYDIGRTHSYSLYNEARMRMGKMYQEMNNNALVDSIMLMENMMQTCIENGNFKQALEIQKELNKCNQLYVKKLELDTKGEPIIINFK
tara:strand:+ start:370 stop:729 length:360 start_codon:yes stop_codon:yes gene_type:complete